MASSRRGFLQASAAGSALAVSSQAIGQQVAKGSSEKLRLASVGVGGSRGRYNRGGSIARDAAKYAEMVAVCDVDDRHAKEFNDSFGGKLNTYRDYREMLKEEKPDVVTIGTPDTQRSNTRKITFSTAKPRPLRHCSGAEVLASWCAAQRVSFQRVKLPKKNEPRP